MSVRVTQKNLPRTIGPQLLRLKLRTNRLEVLFPCINVIHPEREVIVTVAGNDRFITSSDKMKLLADTQPKPRAREIECRTRH